LVLGMQDGAIVVLLIVALGAIAAVTLLPAAIRQREPST